MAISLLTPTAAASRRSPLLLRARHLLLACCAGSAAEAHAQTAALLDTLLFDPVPIEVREAPAIDGEAAYQVRELSVLPKDKPVDLRTWLERRQSREPAAADATGADIERYKRAIAAAELRGGPYAENLSESLLALGVALRRSGDFGQALDVLERASHINRVNHGLFNQEQIPIIEQTIETHLARGDLVAADGEQEYLFYLQRKHFGDRSVDLLPALQHYAEWNLFAASTPMLYSAPPAAPADGDEPVAAPAPLDQSSIGLFRAQHLVNAQNMYQSMVRIMKTHYGSDDARVFEAEKQLALTNYLYDRRVVRTGFSSDMTSLSSTGVMMPYDMAPPTSSLGYAEGLDALERRVDDMRDNGDPLALARAQTDLGDWLFSFKKRMGAIEMYDEAYESLRSSGVAQEEIDALYHPPLPMQVPAFTTHDYSRAALEVPEDLALEYKGYIDVEYSLNHFGTPSSITVLGRNGEEADAVESRLLRSLRRAAFRPRYEDGVMLEEDHLKVRYYFAY